MSTARFDEVIHAPPGAGSSPCWPPRNGAEFKFIRDSLGLSDSALSKRLTILEEAGQVQIR